MSLIFIVDLNLLVLNARPVNSSVRLLHLLSEDRNEHLENDVVLFNLSSPKPDTELAKEAGGAYVSCWINFRLKEGAEHLAKFYLEQYGWNYEKTEEASWVEKKDYEGKSLKICSIFLKQTQMVQVL